MPVVYDRVGTIYEVSSDEAAALLATGAYFSDLNCHTGTLMNHTGTLATIYDVKTGQAIQRRPVDARELVASGKYSFQHPRQGKAAPTPPQDSSTPPEPPMPPQDPAAPEKEPEKKPEKAPLPTLTAENSKAEIAAALSEHGVQYRANMDKADLLELWAGYVAEQNEAH